MIVRHLRVGLLAGVVGMALAPAFPAEGQPPPEDPRSYRGGFAYVGAFFVTDTQTRLSIFDGDTPLGARVDLNEDLGLRNSLTVPRASLAYRFNKRHMINFGWYDLTRDASTTLSRTIDIGGVEFEIGLDVETEFKTELYKLQYTWLFHSDSKIQLGLSAGLFVADLGIDIRSELLTESLAAKHDVTAPLPTLGGRLTYNLTPRLLFLTSADWFFIDYSGIRGVMSDLQAIVSHRTWKHVGFMGGINVQSVRAEYDDGDSLWEVDSGLVGFMAGVSFYF